MVHSIAERKEATSPADSIAQRFVESTQCVFSTMLGCNAELIELRQHQPDEFSYDLSGLIGFSGELAGTIAISMYRQVAFSIAEALLGNQFELLNDEVRDLIGELANMIGGNAKERLTDKMISLGLPTVITGKGHEISFDHGAQVNYLRFETPWGQLTVAVGLRSVEQR